MLTAMRAVDNILTAPTTTSGRSTSRACTTRSIRRTRSRTGIRPRPRRWSSRSPATGSSCGSADGGAGAVRDLASGNWPAIAAEPWPVRLSRLWRGVLGGCPAGLAAGRHDVCAALGQPAAEHQPARPGLPQQTPTATSTSSAPRGRVHDADRRQAAAPQRHQRARDRHRRLRRARRHRASTSGATRASARRSSIAPRRTSDDGRSRRAGSKPPPRPSRAS